MNEYTHLLDTNIISDLIAAHARALDLILVTANELEFSRVPDLRVENWLLP